MMKSFPCRSVSKLSVTIQICKMSTILSDIFCTLPALVRETICWLRALNLLPNFLMICGLCKGISTLARFNLGKNPAKRETFSLGEPADGFPLRPLALDPSAPVFPSKSECIR
jgi:hypothetical protein